MDTNTCVRISIELFVHQREPPLNYFLGGCRPIREGELRNFHAWIKIVNYCFTIWDDLQWIVITNKETETDEYLAEHKIPILRNIFKEDSWPLRLFPPNNPRTKIDWLIISPNISIVCVESNFWHHFCKGPQCGRLGLLRKRDGRRGAPEAAWCTCPSSHPGNVKRVNIVCPVSASVVFIFTWELFLDW